MYVLEFRRGRGKDKKKRKRRNPNLGKTLARTTLVGVGAGLGATAAYKGTKKLRAKAFINDSSKAINMKKRAEKVLRNPTSPNQLARANKLAKKANKYAVNSYIRNQNLAIAGGALAGGYTTKKALDENDRRKRGIIVR